MGLLDSAESFLNNTVNNVKSGLTQPSGSQPIAPSFTVNKGYVVTFAGTDELGNPIGYNPGGNSSSTGEYGPSGVTGIIQAFLPEMFNLGTHSTWAPISPTSDLSGLLGGVVSQGVSSFVNKVDKVGKLAQTFTGFTSQFQGLSAMFWQSTDPLTFNLSLQLNATVDAKAEVTGIVQSLMSLTLPSAGVSGIFGTELRAPGPSLISGGQWTSKYNISMSIGNNWLFPNILIQQVSADFDVLPTVDGDYISATVHMLVTTNKIFTKSDLASAMSNSPAPASSSPGTIQSYANNIGNNVLNWAFSNASPGLISGQVGQ